MNPIHAPSTRKLWMVAALTAFAASPVVAQQLGPAPRVQIGIETPPLHPAVVAKSASQPNPINMQHRGEAVGQFFSRWWPYLRIPAGWTGSIAGCTPGTVAVARLDATIATIDYYRALVALPDTIALSSTFNPGDQQMALMIVANQALSHAPPTSWTCYTSAGAAAAGRSNLALGLSGVDAIDAYMDDYGAGNGEVGHRRWILFPPQIQMGSGDVEGGDAVTSSNALDVLDGWGTRPMSPTWIAWPPPGFVPYWLLPAQSNRWSFSYAGADFSAATVTMFQGATPIPVTYEALASGYGDNTLVWKPQSGVGYAAPSIDTTYNVNVSNVVVGGVTQAFSYAVTVINPVKPARLGDFDGDGQSDLVWQNTVTRQTAIWFMKSGAIDHVVFGALPSGWTLRGTGDLDGDGDADLVWINPSSHQLAIWFMHGSTMSSASFYGVGGDWDLTGIGDFDGSGTSDLFFRNTNGSAVTWLMGKVGIADVVGYPNVGSDWQVIGTGDFLGMLQDQILWRYIPTGDLYLWTNADTSSVGLVALGNPGSAWQLAAIGDFDGDGRTDLFFRNVAGQNAIWPGASSTGASFPPGVGTDWSVLGTTQVYGDGRSNVIWKRGDGLVAQWRFNSTLAPSATFLTTVPSGWAYVSP